MEIGSKEWLEKRKDFITATDLPVIMGVSKFKKIEDLYWEKKGAKETFVSGLMKRGTELEPEALRYFEDHMNELFVPMFVISKKIPWAAATLDGWNPDGTFVEINCPGEKDHQSAIKGIVPKHYYPQVQWQMMVTDEDKMYYCSYHPDHETKGVIFSVARDQKYIDKMLVKAEEFYKILQLEEPPDSFQEESTMQMDNSYEGLEIELLGLLEQSRPISKRIDEIKEELTKNFNSKKTVGKFLTFSPIKTKGAVQYDLIPELKGVDLEAYRKPMYIKWKIDILKEVS